ncbi:MAG: hydroxymethylbilane synthase [Planctomycetota bacterium]
MADFILATRGSELARRQTQLVIADLRQAWPALHFREEIVRTTGDLHPSEDLTALGGSGVFTKELQRALLERRADAAVHSLKDLPVESPAGIRLAAIARRADAADVLVSRHAGGVEALPSGARIGTGSPRRCAMTMALRGDVRMASIRGNVPTRLAKAASGEFDAVILAAAGLQRRPRGRQVTAQPPQRCDHLVAGRTVVGDAESFLAAVLQQDAAVLGQAALHRRQQLRIEDDLQDLVAAHAARRLHVEHLVVEVAEVAAAGHPAQQVGQAEPVVCQQHRLMDQRRAAAEQGQGGRRAGGEVAVGVGRGLHGERGDELGLVVAAALGGELLPGVRRAAGGARQVQVERREVRALHVGIDVRAGDAARLAHSGTMRTRQSR